MGGYDLNKVSGDIKIRYAKEGETFLSLERENQSQYNPIMWSTPMIKSHLLALES